METQAENAFYKVQIPDMEKIRINRMKIKWFIESKLHFQDTGGVKLAMCTYGVQ